MKLIDTIRVEYQGNERQVQLFVGDLTDLPEAEAVDVLIVSAFPDDYTPTASSLIGGLAGVGVSVADLAKNKEVDLRSFSSCWLSQPIAQDGLNFRRILCFEPGYRGKASEVVGDIFRSIVPFTAGTPPVSQIAIPLVAAGALGEAPEVMLEMLTDASVHWLTAGLPLDRIKIVLKEVDDSKRLCQVFEKVKWRQTQAVLDQQRKAFRFDAFVSYSQKNKEAVDDFVKELHLRRPGLRVFLDRLDLRPGSAWQQHIFDSIDQSRKVICALSPDYISSKICKEEFNIALFRHRESQDGVLLPVYLYSADLPTYMKLLHYEDAREGDRDKIALSAHRLLEQL